MESNESMAVCSVRHTVTTGFASPKYPTKVIEIIDCGQRCDFYESESIGIKCT